MLEKHDYKMKPVVTNLSFEDSKVVEQILIGVYATEAITNARNEISVKNHKNFEKEIKRTLMIFSSIYDDGFGIFTR